jgi:Flp pilus assembly protein TadD
MRRARARSLSASLASVLLACASPGPDLSGLDLDGWIELRSPYFVLMGDVSRAKLERFAEDLAVFVAVVERVTNARPGNARVPARIYLTDGQVWSVLKPADWVGGYMAPRLDGYFGVVGLTRRSALTREILLHEYTHFLIRKGRALRYPIWYDEGFAEVMSSVRRRQDLVSLGTPAAGRIQPLLYSDEFDLATVFAPDRRTEIEDAGAFYSIAWAATHYLGTNPAHRERMTRFVGLQADGMDWEQAYARSFDVPIAELSRSVRAHVDALARGALIGLVHFDARELNVNREWEIRSVAPAAVATELGELGLILSGEGSGAALPQAFFARAIEIDPAQARARAGFALARALQGDFEGAYPDLERAVSAAPTDPRIHLYIGHVHRARARAAAGSEESDAATESRRVARIAYARARDLDPDDPSAWAGLGWSYVVDDDPQAGIEALERARALGAWDADVNLDLGRLYRRTGNLVRARERWEEVARVGDESNAEVAQRLLQAKGVSDEDGPESP